MKVWLLKKDSMSGVLEYYKTAYSCEKVAKANAKDMKEEWVGWIPKEFECEKISKNRVIVDLKVYKLDEKDADEDIKIRALKKLTVKEKKVLGLIK